MVCSGGAHFRSGEIEANSSEAYYRLVWHWQQQQPIFLGNTSIEGRKKKTKKNKGIK